MRQNFPNHDSKGVVLCSTASEYCRPIHTCFPQKSMSCTCFHGQSACHKLAGAQLVSAAQIASHVQHYCMLQTLAANPLQNDKVLRYMQDVSQGQQSLWQYQDMVRGLLQRVQAGQPPAPHTLAAHLLGVKDPHTGQPSHDPHPSVCTGAQCNCCACCQCYGHQLPQLWSPSRVCDTLWLCKRPLLSSGSATSALMAS